MNWFGFQLPAAAWLFALLAPVVLFYFLKLKRPTLQVPSLVLWRQVLQDSRVNSPFQRFKRNILLLLQLLILTLVALAAMQPFLRGDPAQAQRMPVLIDCSASMAAFDKQGGSQRLAAAKKIVRERIEGLLRGQELCLISFSGTARKLTGFTDNKRILREALERIDVEDLPSGIEDALRMAQALARSVAFDKVLLVSDGNFPMKTNFELSFTLDYQLLPPAGPNLGITSLNARRAQGGGWDVFACVEASGAESAATVELTVGVGGEAEKRHIVLAKGSAERMSFRVGGEKPTQVRLRLIPDEFDALESDNVAYLDLPAVRSLSVYAAQSLSAFRHALRGIGGVNVWPDDDGKGDGSPYDLVITDKPGDAAFDAKVLLGVGFVPEDLRSFVAVDDQGAEVIDWRRSAPLLQHVELGDLVVAQCPRLLNKAGEKELEDLGYEVLAHGRVGPLLLRKQQGERLFFHLLFHSDKSTLPYRVGFPILVSNAVQIAMRQSGLAEVNGNQTGVLPPLKLSPDKTYGVKGPGMDGREERTDSSGILSGVPAPRVGVYTVAGDGVSVAVGVSLLSPAETLLGREDTINFNEGLTVAASPVVVKADRPLWLMLAFIAFCVLLIEWWYFHRRIASRRIP